MRNTAGIIITKICFYRFDFLSLTFIDLAVNSTMLYKFSITSFLISEFLIFYESSSSVIIYRKKWKLCTKIRDFNPSVALSSSISSKFCEKTMKKIGFSKENSLRLIKIKNIYLLKKSIETLKA